MLGSCILETQNFWLCVSQALHLLSQTQGSPCS